MKTRVPSRSLGFFALICTLCLGNSLGWAVVRDDFEEVATSWKFAGTDAPYRIAAHQRVTGQAHSGASSEQISVVAENGTYVYFNHPIGRAAIHPELIPSLWVRSDRSGIQLLARVVYPRTKDPRSGEPLTALVRGAMYSHPGTWQQLTVTDVPLLVSRQARVLRLQLQSEVDEREAYLDMLVINAYGGRGTTNLNIDDMEIGGYVELGPPPEERPSTPTQVQPVAFDQSADADPRNVRASSTEQVRLVGSVLTAEGRPIFVRSIEFQGESFEHLKRLGFNAVQLIAPPTPWQLEEARRNGLWLICPPPNVRANRSIGPSHDRVLAWSLGNNLTAGDLPVVRDLAAAIRRADEWSQRPLLCEAADELRGYSRVANVLLLDRQPLGTSLELAAYGPWLQARPQLARPGTPSWAAVPTEVHSRTQDQLAALGLDPAAIPVEPEQIRLVAYAAAAAGMRSLMFTSRHRLDADSPISKLRADAVELVNLELSLIEPWLSAGSGLTEINTGDPNVRAVVLQGERSQVVLLMRLESGSQLVTSGGGRGPFSLIVPGVPESSDAYHVAPAGLSPLRNRRVTGGSRVTIDEFGSTALVVFTGDPLLYSHLAKRVVDVRRRGAELERSLAAAMLPLTQQGYDQLTALGKTTPQGASQLNLAKSSLGQSERLLAAGDAAGAYRFAQQAARSLSQLRRACWEQAALQANSSGYHPACASFWSLPAYWKFSQSYYAPLDAPGSIAGGEMESLDQLLNAGWRHFRHDNPLVNSQVELTPLSAKSGKFSLRLTSTPIKANSGVNESLESPPVWVTSGAVRVRRGQWVKVQGWVYVPAEIRGSPDGLLVFDSSGGPELGVRVGATEGWQPVTYYRAAREDGNLHLTVALTGLGEAMIDDLNVVLLGMPPAGVPSPPVPSPPNASTIRPAASPPTRPASSPPPIYSLPPTTPPPPSAETARLPR